VLRLSLSFKDTLTESQRLSAHQAAKPRAPEKVTTPTIVNQLISPTEYSAVRDGGAGLIDLSTRGRLLVSGSESVMFLNGLITNDLKTLELNSWMPAIFPNVQGRLIAAVRIIHRTDGFLIDTEDVSLVTVTKLLERFTLAGDFHVRDITSETAMFSIQGGGASEVVRKSLTDTAAGVARGQVVTATLENGLEVSVIRATHTGEDGFDLVVKADDGEALLQLLKGAGAVPLSADTADALRIEAGIPRFGVDMDETKVVSETNLDDAVSFTKGCYIGQEIIARIKYRGHVARKLTGVLLSQDIPLQSGAKIVSADDKEIGVITSAMISPRLKQSIALGYLKYDYLEPGTNVKVISGEVEHPAVVTDLPFVRGSWYSD
jgi:folate-binding protein YgfZ